MRPAWNVSTERGRVSSPGPWIFLNTILVRFFFWWRLAGGSRICLSEQVDNDKCIVYPSLREIKGRRRDGDSMCRRKQGLKYGKIDKPSREIQIPGPTSRRLQGAVGRPITFDCVSNLCVSQGINRKERSSN